MEKCFAIEFDRSGLDLGHDSLIKAIGDPDRGFGSHVHSVTELPDIEPTACNFTVQDNMGKVLKGHFWVSESNGLTFWFRGLLPMSLTRMSSECNMLTFQAEHNINHPNFSEEKRRIEDIQAKARREERGPRPELLIAVSCTFFCASKEQWLQGVLSGWKDEWRFEGWYMKDGPIEKTDFAFLDWFKPTNFMCSDRSALPQELIDYLDKNNGWALEQE